MSEKFEQFEIDKYWEIFSQQNPQNGKLTGEQVGPLLKNSQLPDGDLAKIWDLSDIDSDGCLDFEEFCIAMRLVYDRLQGRSSRIPDSLPEWLVPQSKAHLVAANEAVRNGPVGGGSGGGLSDNDDDDIGLSTDFDWYISPADKDTYTAIYSANANFRGMITFDSLTELYSTLSNVPDTDVRSAWNLVNPRSEEAIDKDQCLYFLHILNNRSRGVRVPRTVPASLRATFEKAQPEYSLDSKQATVTRPAGGTRSSQKSAFADGYLSRLGLGGRSGGYRTSGTDFSSTKDTDWEEVRLKRELEDLEKQIKRAEEAAERRKKGVEDYSSSRSGLIKRELEQLLDWKEQQLQRLRSGAAPSDSARDLASAKEEVQLIGAQIQSLQEHLSKKEKELSDLKAKVAAF